MKHYFLILHLLVGTLGYSQQNKVVKIENEGKLLFRLEKASWYGTDILFEKFSNKRDSIGGYLSYETEDNRINTIFFSKYIFSEVLIRLTFDSLPQELPIVIDTDLNEATAIEQALIEIRIDARNRVFENDDNFFSFYENASLNFIPVIQGTKKQVFILTGTTVNGVVLLGNDYVLNYDKRNKFKNKIKIHNSLIQLQTKSENSENKITETFHSHVLSDFINSTDICTLLLYREYVEWDRHIVISERQVSIFDLEDAKLYTMTRKAWDRIH